MTLKAQQKIDKFEREALAQSARGVWKLGPRGFTVRAVVVLAERLLAIEEVLATPPPPPVATNGRKKRPPTAWQKFFAEGMKAGKSPAEIGAEWRAR